MSAYLDHAATTPMRPQAVAAMCAALEQVGNASSLHTSGRRVRRVVEEAREQLAALLGAGPSEVVFTAGGTEADNLAVKGLYWARRTADPRRRRILASAVEHHAVLDPVEWLVEHEDAEVVWLEVDALGRVDPEQVRAAIDDGPDGADGVALVSVTWALPGSRPAGSGSPRSTASGTASRTAATRVSRRAARRTALPSPSSVTAACAAAAIAVIEAASRVPDRIARS